MLTIHDTFTSLDCSKTTPHIILCTPTSTTFYDPLSHHTYSLPSLPATSIRCYPTGTQLYTLSGQQGLSVHDSERLMCIFKYKEEVINSHVFNASRCVCAAMENGVKFYDLRCRYFVAMFEFRNCKESVWNSEINSGINHKIRNEINHKINHKTNHKISNEINNEINNEIENKNHNINDKNIVTEYFDIKMNAEVKKSTDGFLIKNKQEEGDTNNMAEENIGNVQDYDSKTYDREKRNKNIKIGTEEIKKFNKIYGISNNSANINNYKQNNNFHNIVHTSSQQDKVITKLNNNPENTFVCLGEDEICISDFRNLNKKINKRINGIKSLKLFQDDIYYIVKKENKYFLKLNDYEHEKECYGDKMCMIKNNACILSKGMIRFYSRKGQKEEKVDEMKNIKQIEYDLLTNMLYVIDENGLNFIDI